MKEIISNFGIKFKASILELLPLLIPLIITTFITVLLIRGYITETPFTIIFILTIACGFGIYFRDSVRGLTSEDREVLTKTKILHNEIGKLAKSVTETLEQMGTYLSTNIVTNADIDLPSNPEDLSSMENLEYQEETEELEVTKPVSTLTEPKNKPEEPEKIVIELGKSGEF